VQSWNGPERLAARIDPGVHSPGIATEVEVRLVCRAITYDAPGDL
jgi:hypothetical protein